MLKKLSAIILAAFTATTVAIAADTVIRSDNMTLGRPGSSTAKSITLDINQGASNPKVQSNVSNQDVQIVTDRVQVGKNAAGNKRIIIDNGAGASNPEIRWNNSTSKIEFANDGSNFKAIGSGGGEPGVNLLADYNADAEAGTSNWTNSGGTFTATSTAADLMDGAKSFEFDPSASGQYVDSTAATVKAGVYGAGCAAKIRYKTTESSNLYYLRVYDGSSNLLGERQLPISSVYRDDYASFPCPSSGTLKMRIYATGDAAKINWDAAFLGDYKFTGISQATMYGYAMWPGTSNCYWNGTPTTNGAFSADSDCTFPTGSNLGGNASAPATKIPGITFATLPAGEYYVVAQSAFIDATPDANTCQFRINDGTNNGASAQVTADGAKGSLGTVAGRFSYSTAQSNITFQVNYRSDNATNTCGISTAAGSGPVDLAFVVYRFPTSTDLAFTPGTTALSWSGYHGTDCLWTQTTAGYTEFNADATCSFAETSNRNFGTVTTYSSGGNPLPGIIFTNPRVGRYEVCATSTYQGSTASAVALQLTDGTSSVESYMEVATGIAGNQMPFQLCGIFDFTSIGSKTVKLQGKTSAGTETLKNSGSRLYWTVKALDQSMPAPVMPNMVQSSSGGVERIERVTVASVCSSSPCTITSQTGGFSSITRSATGRYTANFVASTFSSAPTCSVTSLNGGTGVPFGRGESAPSTSSFSFRHFNITGSADVDDNFSIICMGPK